MSFLDILLLLLISNNLWYCKHYQPEFEYSEIYMKGHQLVSIKRIHRTRALSYLESPIGFIKGVSEEIHTLSPKDRKIRNQLYLKSISPAQMQGENRDSQDLAILKSLNPRSESTSNSFRFSYAQPKKEKIFKLDPNSKFSLQFHEKQGKILAKLNEELFPQEFIDEIHYLPDYTPSVITAYRPIEKTHRSSSSQAGPDSWKISALYNSKKPNKSINHDNLKHSSFTTYSTGWGEFYPRSTNSSLRKTYRDTNSFLPKV